MSKHVRTWALIGLLGAVAVGVTVASLATGGFRIVAGGGCPILGQGRCGTGSKCGAGGQCAPVKAAPGGEKPQAFVNATCPMMGSPIDPEKVAPELVRMHKGRKVGFCCGGCPAAWDKLSEAQKEAKLQGAAGAKMPG